MFNTNVQVMGLHMVQYLYMPMHSSACKHKVYSKCHVVLNSQCMGGTRHQAVNKYQPSLGSFLRVSSGLLAQSPHEHTPSKSLHLFLQHGYNSTTSTHQRVVHTSTRLWLHCYNRAWLIMLYHLNKVHPITRSTAHHTSIITDDSD